MPDQWWIDSAADLLIGSVQRGELLDVYRYKDGFLALWNAPLSGKDLGRWVNTPDQLKTMLRGHWNVGKVVQWDTELK